MADNSQDSGFFGKSQSVRNLSGYTAPSGPVVPPVRDVQPLTPQEEAQNNILDAIQAAHDARHAPATFGAPQPAAAPQQPAPQPAPQGFQPPSSYEDFGQAPVSAVTQDFNAPQPQEFVPPALETPSYQAPVQPTPSQEAPSFSAPDFSAPAFGQAPAAPAAPVAAPAPTFGQAAPLPQGEAPKSFSEMFGNRAAAPAPQPVAEPAPTLEAPSFAAPAFPPAFSAPSQQEAPSFAEPQAEAPVYAAPEPQAPAFTAEAPAVQQFEAPQAEASVVEEPRAEAPQDFAPEVASVEAAPEQTGFEPASFEPAPFEAPVAEEPQGPSLSAIFAELPEETKQKLGVASFDELAPDAQAQFGEYVTASRDAAAQAEAELVAKQQELQGRADAIGHTITALSELRNEAGVSGSDRIEAAALRALLEKSSPDAPEENTALQVGGYDLIRKLVDTLPDSETKDKLVKGAEELIDTGLIEPLTARAQQVATAHSAPEASAERPELSGGHASRIESQRIDAAQAGQYL